MDGPSVCLRRGYSVGRVKNFKIISVEEVIQNELRILFLENRTMEFFLNPPSCSTMKGVSVVVALSILSEPFFYKESAMVAFIFP